MKQIYTCTCLLLKSPKNGTSMSDYLFEPLGSMHHLMIRRWLIFLYRSSQIMKCWTPKIKTKVKGGGSTVHIWYIFKQNINLTPKVKGHPWVNWQLSLFLNTISILISKVKHQETNVKGYHGSSDHIWYILSRNITLTPKVKTKVNSHPWG